MLKVLTLSEFKHYIENSNYRNYYLLTDNQFNRDYYGTMSVSLNFGEVIVSFNPTFIALKQGENYVRFDRPVHIYVDEDCLPSFFVVICSKRKAEDKEFETYTVVAETSEDTRNRNTNKQKQVI